MVMVRLHSIYGQTCGQRLPILHRHNMKCLLQLQELRNEFLLVGKRVQYTLYRVHGGVG